ncbi:MAG: efflux transporter outer membrane subunit [Rhabdochlamydiaceae bacterium]|nr:efflux transporter outer membrane subunit [Candidatus Amphrikana amoebophyrae]
MKWSLWLIVLVLSGCQFYSKIDKPTTSLNSSYLVEHQEGSYPIEDLFSKLNDPILTQLLQEGMQANLDLQVAVERIHQARAQYGVKKSKLWPQVEFEAEVSRLKYSAQGVETLSLFGASVAPSSSAISDLYFTAFDASWEIDLFQKILSEKSAAFHEILAIEEMSHDVYISLQAEIAITYFELRSNQQQVAILNAHRVTREETASLMRERFEAGLTTGIEVDRAEADLYDLEAELPKFETDLIQNLNRLCVLLGKMPGELNDILVTQEAQMPQDPGLMNVEIVSDLLRRRPDVRKAEQEYIRTQYLTRSAKADLFPRFSITGSFGFSSFSTSDLFDYKNMLWSIGPAVRWPIFKGWQIMCNIDKHKSIQKQAMLRYHDSVLKALEDVENSLVLYGNEQKRDISLHKSVTALTQAQDASWELYLAGLTDFNSVLDIQRRFLISEQERIASYESTLKALILIYKSLGGSF